MDTTKINMHANYIDIFFPEIKSRYFILKIMKFTCYHEA